MEFGIKLKAAEKESYNYRIVCINQHRSIWPSQIHVDEGKLFGATKMFGEFTQLKWPAETAARRGKFEQNIVPALNKNDRIGPF